MSSKFVNVKVFRLCNCDWDDANRCYAVNVLRFANERVSVHSVRLDEIVDVDHRAYTMKLVATGNAKVNTDLHYHYIKVKTPSGQGINGISTDLMVSEASHKRICKALDIDAVIEDIEEVIY